MKRFRWWILVLALLLLAGLVLVLSWPKREPLEVTVVSRTNDASGQPYLIIRVSNISAHQFEVAAETEKLVGSQWRPVVPLSGEPSSFEHIEQLPRGETWDVKLPAPTERAKWRVTVHTVREWSWFERFLAWCFRTLRLKYRSGAHVRTVLEFNE